MVDSVSILGMVLPHPRSIVVVQSTKDGGYRGSAEGAHDADVVIEALADPYRVRVHKNRFADCGEFEL